MPVPTPGTLIPPQPSLTPFPDPHFTDDPDFHTVVTLWTSTLIFFAVLGICFIVCVLASLGLALYFFLQYGCPFQDQCCGGGGGRSHRGGHRGGHSSSQEGRGSSNNKRSSKGGGSKNRSKSRR
ncbi:hypothetical protein TYRP_019773 [Tyrophagus putrescentiae]|nr:hypothetical protein TYRP_019773 [Tyrophagus putrescentiae]